MEFSDIALAKLLQTVPELGSLILTFQDVSDEVSEESGINVGVFVLRAGADLFFVPVVSKGDNVYPTDSIFFDSKKKFFPLTKKTINMVLMSSQLDQGKATKIPSTVPINPSVYGLITPPRTGKYAYASTSRLTDFLASMPDYLKRYSMEKIAAEKSMYDELDKMFGLKAIFDVLKPSPGSLAAVTNQVPISVVTGAGQGVAADAVASIIEKGYAVIGQQPFTRTALSIQDFNEGGVAQEVNDITGDRDYEVAFANKPSRFAYIPRMHKLNRKGSCLAIFTNGDYATASSFVTVGEAPERRKVIDNLFSYTPPVLLRDLYKRDTFVIVTASTTFLGPFTARNVVLTHLGVEIEVEGGGEVSRICGYNNFKGEAELDDGILYVQHNSIIIKLASNVTHELNRSINSAAKRKQMEVLRHLGSEINLGFDGVEFSANGRVLGGRPQAMQFLVVKESIDPTQAESFVKQAEVTKLAKIYLSKQANMSSDVAPAEIPNYGQIPGDAPDLKLNGAYNPNLVNSVQQTMPLQDSQVTETAIISELLQVPDMFEQIEEYLPDIEECIDKLGRILFMSRVHIHKLAETTDAESVFAFLAQLKAVYRMLGDNFLKLQELAASANSMEQITEVS